MRHFAMLALMLSLALLIAPGTLAAQTDVGRPSTLTVQGEGRVMVKPDFMRLNLTISTRGANLADVIARHKSAAAQGSAALQALQTQHDGLSIESSGFQVARERPAYAANPPQKPAEPQFVATSTFAVKSRPVAAAAEVIGRLAATGLFEIHSASFGIDDEHGAMNRAREAAVADARERAALYSQAAHVRLLDIATISEGSQPQPLRFAANANVGGDASLQIVPPAEIPVFAAIDIVWRIGPLP